MENENRNNIIEIRAEMMGVLNLSMQQNHVPFIRSITLKNCSSDRIRNLKLCISFDPEFAVSRDIAVDEIEPEGMLEISRTDIMLSFSYLYGLSERVSGTVSFSVADEDGNCLGKSTESLDILTPAEWCGPYVMPELTAAFVMPNVTEVTNVMNRAADILKGWGGLPQFTGYQAKDADIIIYNSSIDGGVESVDDLTGKFALLKEFKAVKEGRVYCTTNDSYQQSLSVAYMTEDIHSILKGKEEGLHYIYKCR